MLINLHKVDMYYNYLSSFSVLVVISIIKAEPCKTPNNEEGECILLRDCPILRAMAVNKTKENTEFVRQSICGFQDLDFLVCCASTRNSDATEDQNKNKTNNEGLLPDRRFCGYQHSDDYSRDTNDTSITEFPWLARIRGIPRIKNESDDLRVKVYHCTGSLINENYVLTAATCVTNPYYMITSVLLGEYHINNNTDCVYEGNIEECSDPVEEFTINKTILHSDDDIALLRLNGKVTYSDYIRPICLPLSGFKLANAGDTLTTSGWGWKNYQLEDAITKKKVLGQLISYEECHQRFAYASIGKQHICITTLENSTELICHLDQGAPLMFSNRLQWHQEGIMSALIGYYAICGTRLPVKYIKVKHYIEWIVENIEP